MGPIIICLVLMLIFLIIYFIYKIKTKQLWTTPLKTITELIIFFTVSSFIITLSVTNLIFRYSMTSIKAIIIMVSLSLLCFSFGLLMNKERIYKNNITIYIGLYLLLLLSITFFIARPSFNLKWDAIFHIYEGSLIPFNTISRYFSGRASLRSILYNVLGNMVLLIPLSFLLMVKNKKYKNILRQMLFLLPLIIGIELFQEITGTGSFDIDDIILNVTGPIIFTFLITRFHIMDKIRTLFYSTWKGMLTFKYILYMIFSMIPLWFILETVIKICR